MYIHNTSTTCTLFSHSTTHMHTYTRTHVCMRTNARFPGRVYVSTEGAGSTVALGVMRSRPADKVADSGRAALVLKVS